MNNGIENLKQIYAARERKRKIIRTLRIAPIVATVGAIAIGANSYADGIANKNIIADTAERDVRVNAATRDVVENVAARNELESEKYITPDVTTEAQSTQDTFNPLVNNGVSEEYYRLLVDEYETIPESVRLSIESGGWVIYITPYGMSTVHGSNDNINAWANYEKKEAYIGVGNKSDLIHEIGHIYDQINEWGSIYLLPTKETEYASLNAKFDTYITETDGAAEYYAESFRAYVLNPEMLSEACPETYAFIISQIEE